MSLTLKIKSAVRRALYLYMGRNYAVYRLFAAIRERTFGNARLYRRRPLPYPADPTMIYMCDVQQGVNGGLTDRLRGMATVWKECKRAEWRLGIRFDTPFRLEQYLQPAAVDWRMEDSDLCFESATPVFCQNYVDGRSTEFGLRLLRARMKRRKMLHVYTNICPSWDEFPALFNELFRPSPALQEHIDRHRAELGGEYEAAVFRFQELLGDFYEGGLPPLSDQGRGQLIEACIARLEALHESRKGRLLVTSDSATFLAAAARLEWVYTIPGRVVHIDFTPGEEHGVYMKSFVDFFMLASARRVTLFTGPRMYPSGFPHAAALVGGAQYEHVKF